jgi:hypothetical protein
VVICGTFIPRNTVLFLMYSEKMGWHNAEIRLCEVDGFCSPLEVFDQFMACVERALVAECGKVSDYGAAHGNACVSHLLRVL